MDARTRRKVEKFADRMDDMRDERLRMVLKGQLKVRDLQPDERKRLARIVLARKRKKALASLYYFCKYVLGYQDMTDMHVELGNFVQGPGNKKLILEPRGSFKSSEVTVGYALWMAVKNPNIRILIDSEEFGKSKAFMREIKDHIRHNEEFRRLFGKLDSKRHTSTWQEHQFNISTRTKHRKETTFSCAGIDVTKVGMHYDLIICDDLVSEKNITTPEQIEKTIKHVKLLLSLLDPGRKLVVIGTRWHFADLYGWILEQDERRVVRGKKPRWRKLIRSAILPDGSLLFPERLTKGFLQQMKQAQGTYIFSCQYLNDPAGGEHAAFKKEWINWFMELPAGIPVRFAILLDPSVGQKNSSDYTAIVCVAVDPMNNWYVLRVDRGHWNPTQIINQLTLSRQRLIQVYKSDYPEVKEVRVAMEVVSFQKVLKFWAKDLMRRREIERFRIIELRTDTRISKELRIRGLVPIVENGRVFFKGRSKNKCSDGVKVLHDEMLQFPVGKTDDCLDALAYLPQIIQIPDALKEPERQMNLLGEIKKRMKERMVSGGDPVVGSMFRGGSPWQT